MSAFPSPYRKDSEGSVGLVFMRVYNKWHGEVKRRLGTVGITHPQFVILSTVGYLEQFEEEITQVMIASMAGVDAMSASQILGLLEKKGFVGRRVHSADTRAKAIKLTEAGYERMVQALPIVEEVDAQFFGALGEKEAEFKRLLDDLKLFEF